MEIREITESICGFDEDFDPKAIVNISLCRSDGAGEQQTLLKELSLFKPIIKIGYAPELTTVDFIFPQENDEDLKAFFTLLEEYAERLHEFTLSENEEEFKDNIPLCYIALFPIANTGGFIYTANPIFWSLSALPDGRGSRVLKLCFDMEHVQVMEGASIQTEDLLYAAECEAEDLQYKQGMV